MDAIASQINSLTIVYWTIYWGADQRKHQSSASLAFVRGIHLWPVNSLHKGPVTRKMFPYDDVIMLCSFCSLYFTSSCCATLISEWKMGPRNSSEFPPPLALHILNCIWNCSLCSATFIFSLMLWYKDKTKYKVKKVFSWRGIFVTLNFCVNFNNVKPISLLDSRSL